jgi:hypothetical protein
MRSLSCFVTGRNILKTNETPNKIPSLR